MHISNLFYFGEIVIIVFIIAGRPCYSQDIDRYTACGESYRCSSIGNISYPFWGGGRPSYCGHWDSAFQLDYSRNVPMITIGSITYQVLSLDVPTRTLTLARDDLVDDNCPTEFLSTSEFNSNFFNPIDKNHGVALYYGCVQSPALVTPSLNQFYCSKNENRNISYFMMAVDESRIREYAVSCTTRILVPLDEISSRFLSMAGEPSERQLTIALSSGFKVQWTGYENLCSKCNITGGRCGSVSVSGLNSFTCFRGPSTGFNLWQRLVIGFSVSGGVIIMVLVVIYRNRRAFMAKQDEQIFSENVRAFLTNHESLTPKRFSYYAIKKMTNSFADKLGEGGYGSVYKGNLFDGRLVAVKVLSDANGNMDDFLNEVDSISRTSHVNIVTLLGFCLEKNIRALVYEFMPNKSIDKFMHNTLFPLSSKTMYKIAVGTARGLEYLHRGCNTRIVHFDIKPENILLDEEFCPKIADFGLAKLCQGKSVVSMLGARGTPGYIAPEVFSRTFGEVSHKSDVYSYGMMVINMVGAGEKNQVKLGLDSTTSDMYFPDFIYKRLELGENLSGIMSEVGRDEDTMKKMVIVSLWCIQTDPLDRPSMGKVVDMLEGDIDMIQIPPKPILFPRAVVNQNSCSPISSSYGIEILET